MTDFNSLPLTPGAGILGLTSREVALAALCSATHDVATVMHDLLYCMSSGDAERMRSVVSGKCERVQRSMSVDVALHHNEEECVC